MPDTWGKNITTGFAGAREMEVVYDGKRPSVTTTDRTTYQPMMNVQVTTQMGHAIQQSDWVEVARLALEMNES